MPQNSAILTRANIPRKIALKFRGMYQLPELNGPLREPFAPEYTLVGIGVVLAFAYF